MRAVGRNVPFAASLCKAATGQDSYPSDAKTPVYRSEDRRLQMMQTVFALGDQQAGGRCEGQQTAERDEDLADQRGLVPGIFIAGLDHLPLA